MEISNHATPVIKKIHHGQASSRALTCAIPLSLPIVSVCYRAACTTLAAGSYGWTGGMGSVWSNDPSEDVTVILMSTNMLESPVNPPLFNVSVSPSIA